MRAQAGVLTQRLTEPRRFMQVVAGPRQVGKSTLVLQALEQTRWTSRYVSADEPLLRDRAWLVQQWEAARAEARRDGASVLVLDEVQKVTDWSETVKRLWDEDTRARLALRVVLLGSAPLLVQRGLSESLAGRFEVIPVQHWSFDEMHAAFGLSVDEYVFYGGYPGAAALIGDLERWRHYVLESLVETTVSRDVLLLSRVDKPALLRRLFHLACEYSGQVLSWTKMLGQLQDVGNVTTLAHYLDLLSGAGLAVGLQKYAAQGARERGSSPKLLVRNTALMSAQAGTTLAALRAEPQRWGRLVESAVGAHLANAAASGAFSLYYWREGPHEVDFVVKRGRDLTSIEVKSGAARDRPAGAGKFAELFKPKRQLLVGGDGIALEEFLGKPAETWVA